MKERNSSGSETNRETKNRLSETILKKKGNSRPLSIIIHHPSSPSQRRSTDTDRGKGKRKKRSPALMSRSETLTFRWERGGADTPGKVREVTPGMDFMT